MDRRSLAVIAIVLVFLMFVVALAGLDNLPRKDREAVAAANSHLLETRSALDREQSSLEKALTADPALFADQSTAWADRLKQDRAKLESSAAKLAALQQLAKANRRTDRAQVARELSEFDSWRDSAIADASQIRSEADRWLSYKRDLPAREEKARASYQAVKAFDLDAATAPVRKAMVDWPLKRDDLQTRVEGLKKEQAEAVKAGQGLPESPAPKEFAAYFQQADRLDSAARDLQQSATNLNAYAGQLYSSWDKVLVDVDRDGGYRERLRTVRTRDGQTTTDEQWRRIDSRTYQEAKRDVGLTLEHKPLGKYDSEAEHVAQPPGYAYVAPVGEANHYGAWNGGVWHWLPEYLILSQMLHASRAPAQITTRDYQTYQTFKRQGGTSFRQWSPGNQTSAGWYKERPRPSWGDKAYNGSKYQNRGAYSGSRYQSRGTFGARSVPRGGGGFRSGGGFRGGRR